MPLPSHPMLDLWQQPNPYYNRRTMEKAVGLSLVCDGNAYVQKVRDQAGKVKELWCIPHDRVTPIWPDDGSEFISGYMVRVDTTNYPLTKEDVLHIRDGVDPRNERLGLSTLKAQLREVCTVNEESGYTASLLHNSAVPGLVVTPDNPASGPMPMTPRESRNGSGKRSLVTPGVTRRFWLASTRSSLLDSAPSNCVSIGSRRRQSPGLLRRWVWPRCRWGSRIWKDVLQSGGSQYAQELGDDHLDARADRRINAI